MQSAHFVLLTMNGWQMVLPQTDVSSLELMADALCVRKKGKFIWTLNLSDNKIPIFAFDKQARLQAAEEADGSIVAVISDGMKKLGIVCRNTEIISRDSLLADAPLPPVMAAAETLFTGIAWHDERLVCLSRGQRLAQLCFAEEVEASE